MVRKSKKPETMTPGQDQGQFIDLCHFGKPIATYVCLVVEDPDRCNSKVKCVTIDNYSRKASKTTHE